MKRWKGQLVTEHPFYKKKGEATLSTVDLMILTAIHYLFLKNARLDPMIRGCTRNSDLYSGVERVSCYFGMNIEYQCGNVEKIMWECGSVGALEENTHRAKGGEEIFSRDISMCWLGLVVVFVNERFPIIGSFSYGESAGKFYSYLVSNIRNEWIPKLVHISYEILYVQINWISRNDDYVLQLLPSVPIFWLFAFNISTPKNIYVSELTNYLHAMTFWISCSSTTTYVFP